MVCCLSAILSPSVWTRLLSIDCLLRQPFQKGGTRERRPWFGGPAPIQHELRPVQLMQQLLLLSVQCAHFPSIGHEEVAPRKKALNFLSICVGRWVAKRSGRWAECREELDEIAHIAWHC